jgi:hypothetical protein
MSGGGGAQQGRIRSTSLPHHPHLPQFLLCPMIVRMTDNDLNPHTPGVDPVPTLMDEARELDLARRRRRHGCREQIRVAKLGGLVCYATWLDTT